MTYTDDDIWAILYATTFWDWFIMGGTLMCIIAILLLAYWG